MSEATAPHKRPARRRSGSLRGMMIAVAVAFGALAFWLANQVPPNITHTEAMTMAAAIERATSQAQLEALLHPNAPRLPQPQLDKTASGIRSDPAEAMWVEREFGSYVFVARHADDAGRTTLVFRCQKNDVLHDYHEVRLERHDEAPKVSDLWSMASGGWLSDLHAERIKLDNGYPHEVVEALMQAIRAHEPAEKVAAAFGRLAEPFRSSQRVGVQFLHTLDRRMVPTFRRGIREYRALHRQSLTADLVVLQAAQLELKQRGEADPELLREARDALDRIKARVDDRDFLEPWLEQLH